MSPKGARRALARHPWIYRGDVVSIPADLPNGGIVRVIDNRRRPLGRATWSERSQIALRFVRWEDEPVDDTFWAARLEAAIERRDRAGMTGPARRVVFGEADGWPGFVVDQYGDCLAIQTLTPAAATREGRWTELLVDRFAPRAVVARNDLKVRRLEGLEAETAVLHGKPPDPFPVTIGDRVFVVDVMGGQKTGAFLDQQRNWVAAARWADGKGLALDAFSGDGGFALHLAPVVERVEAVEISEAAAARGRANAEANEIVNVEWKVANAFDRLHDLAAEGARFGAIALDPPAFAKNRASVPAARRGYKAINLRAFQCLEPGGILVTCSCSYHVDREAFREIVAEAAADAGRTIEVLEVRTQAPDHPVLLSVPETEYLKCLILRAE
ncbi:MAG TPA: class I SAM-dependent rRNA methyltransferase [Gemmatimonadota bacterium]|nr:class I SAM-dependent rRNA methyltransferase [Gemmatimonadota bacterium]